MLKVVETTPRWDFPVHTMPVYISTGDYTKVQVPGYKSVVRTDTNQPLSVVGHKYELFTHKEAVEAVQPILRHFGTPAESYSVERDGAKVVMSYLFKNQTLDVQNRKVGDKVALELKIINSYNQQTSLEFKIAARVLRCLNGMTIPGGGMEIRFRHTKAIHNLELPNPDLVWDMFFNTSGVWQRLGEQDATPTMRSYIEDQSKKLQIVGQKMLTKFEGEFTHTNTMWDLYNAYTRVLTHEMGRVRESTKLERFDRLNHVFDRALSVDHTTIQ